MLETREVEGDNIIYRRRECTSCEHRWTTLEIPVDPITQRALGVRSHLMAEAKRQA